MSSCVRRAGSAFGLALLVALAALATPALAAVPKGFVGMVIDGPTLNDLTGQLPTMVASGVQSVRIEVDWGQTEPQANQPPQWNTLDYEVAEIASRHLRMMALVIDAPSWDGTIGGNESVWIPTSDGPYADFLKALIHRYGPNGSFWKQYPNINKDPIRTWQIWNEEDLDQYWPQPFQNSYARLLKAAHQAIKSVDPGAKVVLGGLVNYSWRSLARLYGVHGARSQFDIAAVHPYTKNPSGVITILGYIRQVMNENGDSHKPIVADEIGWPSSWKQTYHNINPSFATDEKGQATRTGQLLPLLAQNRGRLGLMGFFYYTWAGIDDPHVAFTWAGLFRYTSSGKFVAKPAFGAFKRAAQKIEG